MFQCKAIKREATACRIKDPASIIMSLINCLDRVILWKFYFWKFAFLLMSFLHYNSKNVKMHSLSVSHTVWQTPLILAPSIGSWANKNGDLWFLFCPQREAKAFSHGKDTQRQEHTTYQMVEAVRPDAGHLTKTNKLNVELSEASAGLADTHHD